MNIGKQVEKSPKKTHYFEASPYQGAIVTKVTKKTEWSTNYDESYISVLPGGGKTAIVCWCAKVLEELD